VLLRLNLIGFSQTRMHHSFLRYGRFRKTSFSKFCKSIINHGSVSRQKGASIDEMLANHTSFQFLNLEM